MLKLSDYRSGLLDYNNLPTLDLHGEIVDISVVRIKDFIKDNVKLKKRFIAIVHGISGGKIKRACEDTLKRNKKVIDYGICYRNQGCTIVELDIN
jgi:dsDNA-specific endonuclease/ATPase MutS2